MIFVNQSNLVRKKSEAHLRVMRISMFSYTKTYTQKQKNFYKKIGNPNLKPLRDFGVKIFNKFVIRNFL